MKSENVRDDFSVILLLSWSQERFSLISRKEYLPAVDVSGNRCTKMDNFTVSVRCLHVYRECVKCCHILYNTTAECVYKYIFEMSHLIDSLVYGDGLIWPWCLVPSFCFVLLLSVFLSAVDFLLRMDFVMLVLVLFCCFERERAGSRFGGYCDCPLVMIINKKLWKTTSRADIKSSHYNREPNKPHFFLLYCYSRRWVIHSSNTSINVSCISSPWGLTLKPLHNAMRLGSACLDWSSLPRRCMSVSLYSSLSKRADGDSAQGQELSNLQDLRHQS